MLHRRVAFGHLQRFLQQAERAVRRQGPIGLRAQSFPGFTGSCHQRNDLLPEFVRRCGIGPAAREDDAAQQEGNGPVGEVPQESVQLFLRLVQQGPARP